MSSIALIKLIEPPRASGEVFNVGHTDEISIFQLAKLVKAMTERTSEIVFIPYGQASESGKVRLRSVKAKDA
jgi:nucleoside-diphosphate-sugar epimerase